MAYRRLNLVGESSTTTGTGSYTLAGALTGLRSFSGAGVANNDTVPCTVRMGSEFEHGIYTWQTGGTLVRTLVVDSSNGGAAVNWGAGTKEIRLAEAVGTENVRLFVLAADHTLASTTATEVTGLEAANLLPGVYTFKYSLIVQSSATGTGIGTGINFTGTATARFTRSSVTTATTTATGVIDDVANVLTGNMVEGLANNAFTTTAPNMINGGFATANADCMVYIEGVLIVTAVGNLELWHSSETAANTSVKANSVLELKRAA